MRLEVERLSCSMGKPEPIDIPLVVDSRLEVEQTPGSDSDESLSCSTVIYRIVYRDGGRLMRRYDVDYVLQVPNGDL